MTFGANKSLKGLLEKVADSKLCIIFRVSSKNTKSLQKAIWSWLTNCRH
jgi:hypothetical protein